MAELADTSLSGHSGDGGGLGGMLTFTDTSAFVHSFARTNIRVKTLELVRASAACRGRQTQSFSLPLVNLALVYVLLLKICHAPVPDGLAFLQPVIYTLDAYLSAWAELDLEDAAH